MHHSHAPVAALLPARVEQGYGKMTAFHVGGEQKRWEFFMAGDPFVQVTLAEHQAQPGECILSNESWKMVVDVRWSETSTTPNHSRTRN